MTLKSTEAIPPWTEVSPAEVQSALDSVFARIQGMHKSKRKIDADSLPSVREALINVFQDNETLRNDAAQGLVDQNPEAILAWFLDAEPQWIVRCSVTDSMMSGIWGLKYFVLGARGYAYYHPDFGIGDSGECLPIIATWEASDDMTAARTSVVAAYGLYWADFALPPFMGQWAKGSVDLLSEAVGTVLRARSSRWSTVLQRLRRDIKEDRRLLDSLAVRVAEITKQDAREAFAILKHFLTGPRVNVRKLNLTGKEFRALVVAFVEIIGDGGF